MRCIDRQTDPACENGKLRTSFTVFYCTSRMINKSLFSSEVQQYLQILYQTSKACRLLSFLYLRRTAVIEMFCRQMQSHSIIHSMSPFWAHF